MLNLRVPRFLMWLEVAVFCLAGLSASFSQTAVQSRIVQAMNSGQMTILQGNIHSKARLQYDQGRVNPDMQLQGVSLVFKLSSSQQAALNQLLAEQRDPASANYHKWLTPEQYAARFGMSQDDLDKVTQWLESQGFTGMRVSRGRNEISFDGSVAQIESAFRTEMHHYLVNGEMHFANSTAPALPAAFSDVALAVRGLHDFRPQARARPVVPHFTSAQTGNHFLTPGDFATIYNLPSNFDGTGITIVVAGQTQLGTTATSVTDVNAFRAASGLPVNPPQLLVTPNTGTSTIRASDQDEANLDVEWSGGVAKGATVIYDYAGSAGNVFDAWTDAVDNNRGQIVSVSYGLCEADYGSTFISADQQTAQQANAQGQTLTAASGDVGAADCDGDATNPVSAATRGLSVDLPAGFPEVTGLGGTEFNGDAEGTASGTPPNATATTFWSGTTGGNDKISSALSYIPEMAWNDSPVTGNGEPPLAPDLFATGGGASVVFSKPSWQAAPGVPGDNARDVPDVSLAGSPDHDGFLVCSKGSCTSGFRDNSGNLNVFGGTSVDSQAFAGVLAILNQATHSNGLGNVNPTLYALAANLGGAPTFPFHDVTSGSNIVPCVAGTADCPTTGNPEFGYSAGVGYDLVTGLGSVDVSKLITAWSGFAPSADFSIDGLQTGVSAAGQTATSTITLEALHGFSGTVNLNCALIPPSTTVGITCGFTSPTMGSTTSVMLSGSSAATATLSIVTTTPHAVSKPSADARPGGRFDWWLASGGALFAGIFVVGVPMRRWRWTVMLMLAGCVLLVIGIGCGGGSGGGGGGGGGTTPTAATPSLSPAPGSYAQNVSVTASDTTAGANLYCTTDGSTPTASSPACAAMNLAATTTVKAVAVASGYNNSAVASGTYTITQSGTPVGAYVVQVTAKSGSITHTTNVTVTVE